MTASLDVPALEAWMDGEGLGRGPVTGVRPLTGGTQNVLLRLTRDGRDYVLRRPAVPARARSDETMRREARVLTALRDSEVPHPEVVAACPDERVLGASFYLMEPVDGFTPGSGLPDRVRDDRALQRRMGLSVVDGLAALARVDHVERGLADLSRLDGWTGRQVARWQAQLGSYGDLDGYPGSDLPHVEEVSSWLRVHEPQGCSPGLLHGDVHLGNVLVGEDDLRLRAIVDWELTSLGDPLLDLGHLLVTWPRAEPGVHAEVVPGLPDEDEVVARYAASSGRDVTDLPWFVVLAAFRLGILLEGSRARAHAGLGPPETGERLGAMAQALFRQAAARIG